MINQLTYQQVYLTQTAGGGATLKSLSLNNGSNGLLVYTNTIDTNYFQIASTDTNITIQTNSTISGQGDIEIAPSQSGSANGQVIFTGASLEDTTSTGFANKYLKIVLNGVSYKIALDN